MNYAFGPATAAFVYTQTEARKTAAGINGAAQSATTGNASRIGNYARFNNYELNAHYALTPALSLAGAYTYTDARLDGEEA